jgi:molybdopterin synthase sulfur carrier subunit
MQVTLQYFAVLREQAGCSREQRETAAGTLAELYEEVRLARGLALPRALLKVAVNDEFCEWTQALHPGDHVVFIPPVAGG